MYLNEEKIIHLFGKRNGSVCTVQHQRNNNIEQTNLIPDHWERVQVHILVMVDQ